MKEFIKIISLLIIYLFLTAISEAQVTQEWSKRFNGLANGIDEANSIAVDGTGNVYITGRSEESGTLNYLTLMYNSSGVEQWGHSYNGTGNGDDRAYSIGIDGSGNVYVTGTSEGNGTGYDIVTIKYNSSGVQQWIKTYNGPGNNFDAATSIFVDESGNVYIVGYSDGIGSDADYVTIKYNSSGVQQWIQRYNGTGNGPDRINSFTVDAQGSVYVTGQSDGDGTGIDFVTIKYHSGAELWVKRFNGAGNDNDIANSVIIDGSGNVYVTGESDGNGSGKDYATIKYNSGGIEQWVKTYNGPENGNDRANSIAVDGSGNVYVTGESDGSGLLGDFLTIGYNSAGVEQWVKRYNGTANGLDIANSIVVDSFGKVYVSGTSIGSGTSYDYLTIRYNSNGNQQWIQRYNGPVNGSDIANSLFVDGSGNVYVTGRSEGNGSDYDYVTIKYSQQIGIRPISSEIPDDFSLSQNYPNPFNPETKIKFDIPKQSQVRLTVYDILGQKVETLVNEQLKPGTYEVEFEGSRIVSGVYFYNLLTEEFQATKKMILTK